MEHLYLHDSTGRKVCAYSRTTNLLSFIVNHNDCTVALFDYTRDQACVMDSVKLLMTDKLDNHIQGQYNKILKSKDCVIVSCIYEYYEAGFESDHPTYFTALELLAHLPYKIALRK